jgi:hypothetical protein
MTPSDAAIDLDIGAVSVMLPGDQRVGPDKATEPGRISEIRALWCDGGHATSLGRA